MTPRRIFAALVWVVLALGLPAAARADEQSASGQLSRYQNACVGPVYSDGSVGIQFHATDYTSNTGLRFRLWWSADDINYTKIYKQDDIIALGVTVNPSTAPQYYPGYFSGCVVNYDYNSLVSYGIWIGPVTSPNAWCPPTGIC